MTVEAGTDRPLPVTAPGKPPPPEESPPNDSQVPTRGPGGALADVLPLVAAVLVALGRWWRS